MKSARFYYTMTRKFLALVAIALAAACASTPKDTPAEKAAAAELKATGYTYDAGPNAVGVIPEATLHDAVRHKEIALSIEYPQKAEKNPVIIFSPEYGLGGARPYVGFSSYWASNGYVVIRVSHADAGRMAKNGSAAQTASDWRDRATDVATVINALDALEGTYPELQGKLDKEKIGVGGHEYGAFTALLLAGARTFPGAVSYAEPRVKAVVAMSPQGPTPARGLTEESWANVKVPALFISGSRDNGTTDAETPEWRHRAFELSPAGDKWFVSIEGARSVSFLGGQQMPIQMSPQVAATGENIPIPTDDPRTDPRVNPRATDPARLPAMQPRGDNRFFRERDLFNTAKIVSLAFWDAYLKGDAKGREYLDKLSQRSDLKAERK